MIESDKTSVIIPTYKEQVFLSRTVHSLLTKATGKIEVIVVIDGETIEEYLANDDYNVLKRKNVRLIRLDRNLGERIAMNRAAEIAKGKYLFRCDAHCDFNEGWDIKLKEATPDRGIAVSVIVPMDKNWNVLGGSYELCRLTEDMEEKWFAPPENHLPVIVPTMAFTGCGFMMRKDFYAYIGGCDESLYGMGAIGSW